MRRLPLPDPLLGEVAAADAIETVIVSRLRDVGAFTVRRALPAAQRQMVGPFIFLDHVGPGIQIGAMHRADKLGLREVQFVKALIEGHAASVQLRAHRAIA